MPRILFLLTIAAVAIWLWAVTRAPALFRLRIKNGRIVSARGRIPSRLFSDLREIAERGHVRAAKISALIRDGEVTLHIDGEFSPDVLQSMRNVAGQFTAAEIRAGKKLDG